MQQHETDNDAAPDQRHLHPSNYIDSERCPTCGSPHRDVLNFPACDDIWHPGRRQ